MYYTTITGEFKIKVVEAKNLIDEDEGVECNPFVRLIFDENTSQASKTIYDDLNPKFNTEFIFNNHQGYEKFKVQVWNEDRTEKDDLIGEDYINISEVISKKYVDTWIDLTKDDPENKREIHLIIEYTAKDENKGENEFNVDVDDVDVNENERKNKTDDVDDVDKDENRRENDDNENEWENEFVIDDVDVNEDERERENKIDDVDDVNEDENERENEFDDIDDVDENENEWENEFVIDDVDVNEREWENEIDDVNVNEDERERENVTV